MNAMYFFHVPFLLSFSMFGFYWDHTPPFAYFALLKRLGSQKEHAATVTVYHE
ncbi:hypothetical protein ASPVEDRAFT_464529 [Aspergillus versicolor CBS 583.65]|uniref:Uncharacterized protein n=1 Tax=Aspergillus versicolor CBS 583.65 TaxID=1036611 RepID=A0A1L9PAI0_ASPVE|nr:uncharacterized protein ASPVEDRAFT_464529 [Aspergillus versicolor CBS 583.65]OJI98508.1 hypothetical protein ASPVEDRAFT_464529 [Aspergillus versicolor CBS 583.65]